jgi:uncharacterized protein (TIGR03435 family)
MRIIPAISFLAVFVSGVAQGQSGTAQQFEVASIKPSKAENGNSSGMNTGHGRVDANNVTLKRCIMGAYGVGPNQILGGPEWLDSERFEITAKAEQPVGDRILMTMMQSLLAERFKLALHREAKPIQAYVLEVKKTGPQLEKGDGQGSKTSNGRGDIVAINTTMDRFAEILSRQMDLPVVNRTGLEGMFNLKLKWTPESTKPVKPGESPVPEGPTIYTAVQEQLGLRLHAQKVPVDVLVIDHAEKPSAN